LPIDRKDADQAGLDTLALEIAILLQKLSDRFVWTHALRQQSESLRSVPWVGSQIGASTPTPALAIREAGAYGKIFGFNSDAALTCLGVWESQATMEYVPCTGSVPMTLTSGNRRRDVRMSILSDALPPAW